MTTAEERLSHALRIFGGPAGVAAVDDYVNRIADAAPPLDAAQKARLRILLRAAPAADLTIPPPLRRAA